MPRSFSGWLLDDGSIEIEAVIDDNESFAVDRGEDDVDDDDVLLAEFDDDDDLLPTTAPARRKSLHGRRVQQPTVPPPRNICFETADDLMYRQDNDGSFDEKEQDIEEAGMERYTTRWVPATVKLFFLLLACLLAAIPSEQGGKQLWETVCMKGVCARPGLDKILKLKRFKQLKGLYPTAFAASEETTNYSKNWS
jgi:hypothetical protein